MKRQWVGHERTLLDVPFISGLHRVGREQVISDPELLSDVTFSHARDYHATEKAKPISSSYAHSVDTQKSSLLEQIPLKEQVSCKSKVDTLMSQVSMSARQNARHTNARHTPLQCSVLLRHMLSCTRPIRCFDKCNTLNCEVFRQATFATQK